VRKKKKKRKSILGVLFVGTYAWEITTAEMKGEWIYIMHEAN
jgi:hypothetical protein